MRINSFRNFHDFYIILIVYKHSWLRDGIFSGSRIPNPDPAFSWFLFLSFKIFQDFRVFSIWDFYFSNKFSSQKPSLTLLPTMPCVAINLKFRTRATSSGSIGTQFGTTKKHRSPAQLSQNQSDLKISSLSI